MDKIDQRARREQEDRLDRLPSQDHQHPSYTTHPTQSLLPPRNGSIAARGDGPSSGYSLMVAGQPTGKTALLRLLLDTSDIASTTSQEQLASVAKFVQGCAGHTSHIRTVSFDIELDSPESSQHPISLTLTDTPSLDARDEVASERVVADILRHVETKFSESLEDVRCSYPLLTLQRTLISSFALQEYKARTGNHHIHLYVTNPLPRASPSFGFLMLIVMSFPRQVHLFFGSRCYHPTGNPSTSSPSSTHAWQ
jgi:hypothetical protein